MKIENKQSRSSTTIIALDHFRILNTKNEIKIQMIEEQITKSEYII